MKADRNAWEGTHKGRRAAEHGCGRREKGCCALKVVLYAARAV